MIRGICGLNENSKYGLKWVKVDKTVLKSILVIQICTNKMNPYSVGTSWNKSDAEAIHWSMNWEIWKMGAILKVSYANIHRGLKKGGITKKLPEVVD